MIRAEHIVYWKIGAALFAGLNCYTLLLGWQLLIAKLTGSKKAASEWKRPVFDLLGRPHSPLYSPEGKWVGFVPTDARDEDLAPSAAEKAGIDGWYRDKKGGLRRREV